MVFEVQKKTMSRGASTIIWLVSWSLIMIYHVGLAERVLEDKQSENFVMKRRHFFWYSGKSSYERVWPVSLSNILILYVMFLVVY